MSNPNHILDIEFQRIQTCPHCQEEVCERHDNTVCLECELSLEGEKPEYKYLCSHCKELRDVPECSCDHVEFDKYKND